MLLLNGVGTPAVMSPISRTSKLAVTRPPHGSGATGMKSRTMAALPSQPLRPLAAATARLKA